MGAGSSGVRLYVTVRVTTWRTLTGCADALFGPSNFLDLPSRYHSVAENGERMVIALLGDSEMGECAGDGGIRKRRSALVGVREDLRGADRRGAERTGERVDEDVTGADSDLCLSGLGN